MSTEEENKPQTGLISDEINHEPEDEIRHAFDHCGGKFVGRIVPVQTEKENPFEHLSAKCVFKPSDHPMFKAKPGAPEKKGAGTHTD